MAKRARMLVAAATMSTMAMGVMAETTVNVAKFRQTYPYSGKAVIDYVVGGTLPSSAVAEITLSTDDASAIFVHSNIVVGANSREIDRLECSEYKTFSSMPSTANLPGV